jgi:hypothetical protein
MPRELHSYVAHPVLSGGRFSPESARAETEKRQDGCLHRVSGEQAGNFQQSLHFFYRDPAGNSRVVLLYDFETSSSELGEGRRR